MMEAHKILTGKTWTYRSFMNDADQNTTPDDLLFGQGKMIFEQSPIGKVNGYFDFGEARLNFRGYITYGNPFTLRYQGTGINGTVTEGWVYDYLGYYIPYWPNGIDQVDAIAGSVIRTAPHSNGQAKAGLVASFYAC
ncbi:hypothetical protein LVD17_07195 [Fulvivirga ulvae]|uniref:hypothetical protein n=1 Tax=Fulvivirga ulvae TaxID=2904245 RepID=UPI001F430ED7|nr:hypothetical protein [Fulvivirga ulvae]UII33603.1 hypothetical protein LVD17_07195 [Fulvivirga ulvae]